MRRNITLLVALLIAGFAVASENPKLISCPDCGHSVSRRAFMCPQCGCRAKAIEQAAKEIESKPKPRIPDRIVRANVGREVCDALPVKTTDGSFVVLPLEKVLDIETLEFSYRRFDGSGLLKVLDGETA